MTNNNSTNRKSIVAKLSDDIQTIVLGSASAGFGVFASIQTSSAWPIMVWLATVLTGIVLMFTGALVPRSLVKAEHRSLESENKRLRRKLEEQER